MSRAVYIQVSIGLRNLLLEEKRNLKRREDKKVASRRRLITNVVASDSLVRKFRKC